MAIIGYARVSTTGQTLAGQVSALLAAGADRVVEETGSGGNRQRPGLAQLLGPVEEARVSLALADQRAEIECCITFVHQVRGWRYANV